ncbi:hypothetical protein LAL4801_05852 [Roseibium aggregatum]|uniref:Uncharacterized protein n=1 Tax=Roseibium aggregatum TaxID=187304 RepID=A0A0M6YEZ7_9HYPH|nr:hypothetical protein LAL4801_05852 [Roseibium aggregatum]
MAPYSVGPNNINMAHSMPSGGAVHTINLLITVALSTSDDEDLLAERDIGFSRETIRKWMNRFGRHFGRCIRRDRPKPNTQWHLNEAVIVVGGVKYWL